MKQLTEFETQTLAHMMAIEYVLAYLGKVAFLDAGLGMEEVASIREDATRNLDRETFPGTDAVWSDHLAAEISDHAALISQSIETMMRKTLEA